MRLLNWSLCAVIGTLFVVFTTDFWWNRETTQVLRRENISRVAPGMKLPEVEELLGGPPGNYGSRHVGQTFNYGGGLSSSRYSRHGYEKKSWWNDNSKHTVVFDSEGRVVGDYGTGYHQEPRRGGFLAFIVKPPPTYPNTAQSAVVSVLLGVLLIGSVAHAWRWRARIRNPAPNRVDSLMG